MTNRVRVLIGLLCATLTLPLLLPASAVPSDAAQTSVIGGRLAGIGEYPWLAYIRIATPDREGACTGGVIAPRVVITAAHCVVTPEARLVASEDLAVLTNSEIAEPQFGTVHRVSAVIPAPRYQVFRSVPDLALLILADPSDAQPLPVRSAAVRSGASVRYAGWGLRAASGSASRFAYQGGALVIGERACRTRVRAATPFYRRGFQLCAEDPRRRATICSGDSGAPVVAAGPRGYELVGVASMSSCAPRISFVASRVSTMSGWIGAWVSFTDGVGPQPELVPPEYDLPFMSSTYAKRYVVAALAENLPGHLVRQRLRGSCQRISEDKIKCRVRWWRGQWDYAGGVTVYYALPNGGRSWRYSYRVKRTHYSCRFVRSPPCRSVVMRDRG